METHFPQVQDSSEAREYNRLQRRLTLADALFGIAMLAILLVTGWSGSVRNITTRISGGSNYVLALFLYVLILATLSRILSFPLDYYGFRLEHQYKLSNQKIGGWLIDEAKSYLLGLAFSTLLTQLIYLLIRRDPNYWWVWAWALFLGLFVALAQLAPVLLFPIFYRFRALENDALRDRLTRLSERAGARIRGVYEWNLSEKSKKANAALMGLGRTRRIVLADTLLANYTDDEIEAVLAHELGHHVHKHIAKSIIVQAVISFAGFWVVKTMLRRPHPDWYISQVDFANLPLLMLVATLMSLLLLPLMNAYSRFNERQADLYAWKAIASINPFLTAMNKLAVQNLAERAPARWVEFLFHSHPSISKRIAAAERWAAKSSS
jgi:STE24 endopeptidase